MLYIAEYPDAAPIILDAANDEQDDVAERLAYRLRQRA